MNFLNFIESKKSTIKNQQIFNEAYKNSDFDKARKLIISILKKQTKKLILFVGNYTTESDGNTLSSDLYVCDTKPSICFTFNWLLDSRSSEVYSISFYKNMNVFFDGYGKIDLNILTLGSSIVHFIPIISHIIQTSDFNLSVADAKKYASSIFKGNDNVKESEYWVGALKYSIFEGLSKSVINNTFNYNINEENSDYQDMLNWKKDKQKEHAEAWKNRNDSPEAKDLFKRLNKEYEEIKKAVKGGATSIEEVKLAIEKSKPVKVQPAKGALEIELEMERAQKDPDQIFKEMYKYISMVASGRAPSLIICGAPGVGKTWKTHNKLEQLGYEEDVNLYTIKGKCTTRRLYMHLYDFQRKGDIVLIDDADAIVGPKADENSINILKAALDSTTSDKGRLISYGIGGKIFNDDGLELPKKFYYNGSVIILTNYNAGQLNTALRGRSYIQDIHFTTEQTLEIIKKLMPGLDPEKLSAKAKMKAYDYLMKLYEQGNTLAISIRSFVLCANMYESNMNDEDFNEEETQSMIKEQLVMQSLRGGTSY